jgi:hypothetical protein
MNRVHRFLAPGLVVFALGLGWTIGQASESQAEQVLAKSGLKLVGSLYVLDAESEAKAKLKQVRLLSKRWNDARVQQASAGSLKDHQELVRDLTARVNQIRNEINAVNQQAARLPRFRNRFMNNYVQEQHAELNAYRNELNLALGQQNALLSEVKSRPPDPKLKPKLDSDVEARREEYTQAVRDLVEQVHTTREKYASLSKNGEVKRALAQLEGMVKPSPKLGPTHEFVGIVKLVEKLEKNSPETSSTASSKTGHGSRHTPK